MERAQSGGGASPRPPGTDGNSREALERREWQVASRVVCGESVAGELERRSGKPREDLWEVSVGGVSSMANSGCLL
jgi:hypothetical protein